MSGKLVLMGFPPRKIFNFRNWGNFLRVLKKNQNYDITANKFTRPGKVIVVVNKRLSPKPTSKIDD